MAYGGSNNAPGPQGYAFLATGPTAATTLAATTVTMTMATFVTTGIAPTQMAFWNLGAVANATSVAFVAFGTGVTVAATTGAVIVPLALMGANSANRGDLQVLTTGKKPTNVLTIGSVGTTTVFITPGEGSV